MRALLIQHEQDAPGGLVSTWLRERGAQEDVYVVSPDAVAPDPRDYDLIVSLGSEESAYDDAVPWLEREATLLRDAVSADLPVLGICFGSQLLARALGGRALPGAQTEIGWVAVHSSDPQLVGEGPWFEWHHDTFAPPPGAVLLAENPAGPQAYMVGRSLGVQFHPEVTPAIVEEWVALGGEDLARHGVDPGRLLADTRGMASENRARACRLFDAFVDRVARIEFAA